MPFAMPSDTKLIRPGTDAHIRRCTVGTGGVTAGAIVHFGSDGVKLANGTTASLPVFGIAIKTASAGERTDIVTYGPVHGYVGGTIGARVYPTDGAATGLPTESVSTGKHSIGVMQTADTLFVVPLYIA